MKVEWLEWDSAFFEMKVGRYDFLNTADWDDKEISNWDLVYVLTRPDNQLCNDFLTEMKISLTGAKITYLLNLSREGMPQIFPDRIHPYYTSADDDKVINIGIQSSVYSRFNNDPGFQKVKAMGLYKTWMKRSINREIADEVYVFENEIKHISGVITMNQKDKQATIGILAVDEKSRGQNIGKELVNAAIAYGISHGCKELRVATQKANKQACLFYQRCGFKEEQVVNIYHYWKKSDTI